ncbi:LADA_0B07756g1_1 [Lachancea dasiensis]|uniref:Succinate dehydrogenase assembly factor 2, mitochondrial n=1 Tax=Lachancea dasiensis TaxID=1072105 RepID=A0A1G4ITZ2_9SACH|nr:LADA_0B07756g1_1 [Lachancea dasiensis]
MLAAKLLRSTMCGVSRPVTRISTYQLYSTNVSLKIPPIKRVGESLDRKKARLVYQSRKRGILETDLLLSRFAAKYLNSMTPEELDEYDALLDELDWDIYYWATKNYTITPLPEKFKNSKLLLKLQDFSENKDKEILRMPELHEQR